MHSLKRVHSARTFVPYSWLLRRERKITLLRFAFGSDPNNEWRKGIPARDSFVWSRGGHGGVTRPLCSQCKHASLTCTPNDWQPASVRLSFEWCHSLCADIVTNFLLFSWFNRNFSRSYVQSTYRVTRQSYWTTKRSSLYIRWCRLSSVELNAGFWSQLW